MFLADYTDINLTNFKAYIRSIITGIKRIILNILFFTLSFNLKQTRANIIICCELINFLFTQRYMEFGFNTKRVFLNS